MFIRHCFSRHNYSESHCGTSLWRRHKNRLTIYCIKADSIGYSMRNIWNQKWIVIFDSNLIKNSWWVRKNSNLRPSLYQSDILTNWTTDPCYHILISSHSSADTRIHQKEIFRQSIGNDHFRVSGFLYKGGDPAAPSGTATLLWLNPNHQSHRRRRSLALNYRLRVKSTLMVWQAVCTRPGNVFTAAFWSAITSNSSFMPSSCRGQSELGRFLRISFALQHCDPLLPPL